MILVTLGTQDKSFVRLLKEVDNLISKKVIKEEVVVQAGYTKYKSDNMKIFDYTSDKKLNDLIKEASYVITHGGVGSILSALKMDKKVIAVARRKDYKEHTNDHQEQVVHELSKEGYIIEIKTLEDLEDKIKNIKKFIPRKFKSNKIKFVNKLSKYIDDDNHISWWNKSKYIIILIIILLLIRIFIL